MFKKIFSAGLLVMVFNFAISQETAFPDMTIPDLQGNNVDLKALSVEEGEPVVLAFWATWCGPCLLELNAINDVISDWREESTFKFYAISVDDSKTVGRVQPLVNGKGWDFDILLDTNNDLKRQLNFSTPPYTMIIKNGIVVYKHIGYQPGAEDELYEKIKEYTN